jgi:aryl-alcohol dehydrogenase-like predicted oxidoreductase
VSDDSVAVQALLRCGKLRDDVFITTKIHPQDLGYQPTMAAFKTSLNAFSTDYIDLVLLHYAACFGSLCSTEPKGTWRESWRVLEDLVRKGHVLAIGAFCVCIASNKRCTEVLYAMLSQLYAVIALLTLLAVLILEVHSLMVALLYQILLSCVVSILCCLN